MLYIYYFIKIAIWEVTLITSKAKNQHFSTEGIFYRHVHSTINLADEVIVQKISLFKILKTELHVPSSPRLI